MARIISEDKEEEVVEEEEAEEGRERERGLVVMRRTLPSS